MTISKIINTLKMSGVSSKKQVIDMLENASENELIELAKDCYKIVAEKRVRKGN